MPVDLIADLIGNRILISLLALGSPGEVLKNPDVQFAASNKSNENVWKYKVGMGIFFF